MARDGIEPSTFRFSEGSATVNWVFLVLYSHTQFVGVSVWSLMGLCGVVESVHIPCTRNCQKPARGSLPLRLSPVRARAFHGQCGSTPLARPLLPKRQQPSEAHGTVKPRSPLTRKSTSSSIESRHNFLKERGGAGTVPKRPPLSETHPELAAEAMFDPTTVTAGRRLL